MAAATGNEVDDVIRELRKISGFGAYVILNNDGIVIKFDGMDKDMALHHAHLVLSLYSKATKFTKDLFDPPDNEVESIRMITRDYEMIIAQHGNFTLVVSHSNKSKADDKGSLEGEKKEGEPEKKESN